VWNIVDSRNGVKIEVNFLRKCTSRGSMKSSKAKRGMRTSNFNHNFIPSKGSRKMNVALAFDNNWI